MKTRVTVFLFLVAAAAGAFWFSASVSATEKKPTAPGHNVVINQEGIVIPGTEISKADEEAMNRILNKYDKSLYRVDTYENGRLKKAQGKLSDVVTDKQLASEIAANVKRTGFTQFAVQIRAGSTTNPQRTSNPAATTNPQRTSNPAATTNPQRTSNPAATTNPQRTSNPAATTNPQHTSTGSTTNPQHSANASPSPGVTTNPQHSSSAAKEKSDELAERLKPILEKYRKK